MSANPFPPLLEETGHKEAPHSRFSLHPGSKLIFGLTIFASAFLLFQVQPLIAKIILPWFGGVAAVWAVCLLFFQVTLLLGYLYAHLLTQGVPRRFQGYIHVALLATSLLVLPIFPNPAWQPRGPGDPAWHILWLLALTIGLPFFLLSSTSPLLQLWYSRARNGASPYRFYALSNAGSLLALVSYPVLFEPRFSNSHQAIGWSVAYAAVAALCAALALTSLRAKPFLPVDAPASSEPPPSTPGSGIERDPPRPGWKAQTLWLALAACGSALLLAVTNHITQNVASVPFLWVIPLSLYLLSFILCFEGRNWYRRDLILRLLVVALGGMAYALAPRYLGLPFVVLLPLFCLGLFVCCMFCHGELARRKPDPAHLTSFYLMISLGGALGAVFVALVAPHLFSGYYELQVALAGCAVLVHVVFRQDPTSPFSKAGPAFARVALATLTIVFVGWLALTIHRQEGNTRLSVRNFYGVLRVLDGRTDAVPVSSGAKATSPEEGRYRRLVNGTIDHGLEFLAAGRRDEPTTYYSPNSGVGVALRAIEGRKRLRVGAIGLGAGTIAIYGRAGDHYTFYEINPLDIDIAGRWFHFLGDSKANIEVVRGDARLSLEREPPQRFDLLAVDAFTGDSIPVHLLTLQAFQLYFRQLRPAGVLAVHISNRSLNLEPVVEAAAAKLGKEAVRISNPPDYRKDIYKSVWILLGSRQGFLGRGAIERAGHVLSPSPGDRLWTDDYSSLFSVLK